MNRIACDPHAAVCIHKMDTVEVRVALTGVGNIFIWRSFILFFSRHHAWVEKFVLALH